jgi:3-hydroxybutyryl-CoA dehydrogenase
MSRFAIVRNRESRSFPEGDTVLASAVAPEKADVVIHLGGSLAADPSKRAVLVELGTESLAVHTGEDSTEAFTNVVGFARYRNGDDPPSNLVELVKRPWTQDAAVTAAREVLEGAGLAVVVSADQPGRIIDRLVRPKYNAALRLLDEGLATQKDMDLTCRLGLGYADGPIGRVWRGGLAHHHAVTQALFETYGTAAYAPPRQAVVAARREKKSKA